MDNLIQFHRYSTRVTIKYKAQVDIPYNILFRQDMILKKEEENIVIKAQKFKFHEHNYGVNYL